MSFSIGQGRLHGHRIHVVRTAAFAVAGLLFWAALRWLLPARVDAGIVVGNGSVEATEITISSKIPGRLSSLNVDDGSQVRRNMTVATIDSDELRARLQQAESEVAASQSQVVQARAAVDELEAQDREARTGVAFAATSTAASIAQAQAAIAESLHAAHAAQAGYVRAHQDYIRTRMLAASGDIPRAQYDAAKAAYEAALAERDGTNLQVQRTRAAADQADSQRYAVLQRQEDVGAAIARIQRGEAQTRTAQAQYQAAVANLQAARAAFRDTRLLAPAPGVVLRVISQNGEVVAPGTPVLTLVDPSKLYVRIYLSEIDAGRVRIGDRAAISVDSFPSRTFAGTVSQIDESAQFTPKTVHMADERTRLVYGVKIALSNADGALKPGMIADARIAIDERNSK